jgi:hypothetical protein
MVKTAVAAPMPNASVSVVAMRKSGERRRDLRACLSSIESGMAIKSIYSRCNPFTLV